MKKNYYFTLMFLLVFVKGTIAQNSFDLVGGGISELIAFPGPSGPTDYVIDHIPLSNYHFFNPYYFNPAMAGIEDKKQLNADWNRQSDHSFLASYDQPIPSINSALGMYFSYSSNYLYNIRSYGLAYNYGFKIKDNAKLKLGFQFSQISISLSDFIFLRPEESSKKWYNVPSLDIGMAFQVDQLRLGVSIQNLFPYQLVTADNETTFNNVFLEERVLNISFANTFNLSEKWHWTLAALIRSNDINDISSYISFRKKYFVGTTFRTEVEHHWIGFVGLKIKGKMNLQFSFNAQKDDNEDKRFVEALAQYQF